MFLLLKQGILSALKNKSQMFVFIVLLCITSILGTCAYTTTFRLSDSNKYMGYGTFSYDYSFNYIATSNDQNDVQTISPWFSFNNDYLSYGDNVAKRTYSTLSIGDNEAIKKVRLTEKNFNFELINSFKLKDKDKSEAINFNIDNVDIEQGVFGDLYRFNLNSDNFKTSLIGQIYKKAILNNNKDKEKAKKIVSDYMKSLNVSILTKFIKDLIIEFVKKNSSNPDFSTNAQKVERVNEFINGIDNMHWPTKITSVNSKEVADVEDDILTYKGKNDPKWGLRGNIGLLVKDEKSSNLNFKYRYFLSNAKPNYEKEAQKTVLETGSFKIRNINKSDFYDEYINKYNSDFIKNYYALFDSTKSTSYDTNQYQDVSVGQLKHLGKKQTVESDFERFKLYFADNFNNLDVISLAIKDIDVLKTDSDFKDKLRFNTNYTSCQENPLVTSRYNLLVKTIKMYTIFMAVCIVFLTLLVIFITVTLLRKLIEKQKTQIGIFKSNGYSNFKIIISYWANMVTPILFGTLIGWFGELIYSDSNNVYFWALFYFTF